MHSSNMSMDTIDSWRPHSMSDLSMSYSSGGQPPSIEDVRHIAISESLCSIQMYSDGQPPSLNDVGGREPSQSEASCNGYEGPDSHEVLQPHFWEINLELSLALAGPRVNLPETPLSNVPEGTRIRFCGEDLTTNSVYMASSCWPESLRSSRIKAIEELTQGQHLATKLRQPDVDSVDDVVKQILGMFDNTLSILNSSSFNEVADVPSGDVRSPTPSSLDDQKSEDYGESSKTTDES